MARTPTIDPTSLDTVADLRTALEAANRNLALREVELGMQRLIVIELGKKLESVDSPFVAGDPAACFDAIQAIVQHHLLATEDGQRPTTH